MAQLLWLIWNGRPSRIRTHAFGFGDQRATADTMGLYLKQKHGTTKNDLLKPIVKFVIYEYESVIEVYS